MKKHLLTSLLVYSLIHAPVQAQSKTQGLLDTLLKTPTLDNLFGFLRGSWGDANVTGAPVKQNRGINCDSGSKVPAQLAKQIPNEYTKHDRSGVGAFMGDNAPLITKGALIFFETPKNGYFIAQAGPYQPGGKQVIVGPFSATEMSKNVVVNLPYQSQPYNLSIIGPDGIGLWQPGPDGKFASATVKKRYYRCQTGN